MKNIFSIILFVILSVVFIPHIYAVCENDEINDWAENVKVIFTEEKVQEKLIFEDGTVIEEYVPKYEYVLSLDPMRDDIYMVSTDSLSKEKVTIKNDSDDFYSDKIGSMVHFDEKKYTIEIYVKKDAKVCAGEKVRTIEYTVEPYNMYTQTTYCEDNPNADICNSYKDTSDVTEDEFEEIVEESKPKTTKDIILNIIKGYWYTVIIPIVVVSIIYIIRIKRYKKKKDFVDDADVEEDNIDEVDQNIEEEKNEVDQETKENEVKDKGDKK